MMDRDPLRDPVDKIYGVGEAASGKLAKLGVTTVFDLLNMFPRKYEDWSDISNLAGLDDGMLITFKATVKSVSEPSRFDRLGRVNVIVDDGYGTISITYFHGKFVATEMHRGDEYYFRGVVSVFKGGFQLINPKRIKADKMGDNFLRPVYRQTAGITSKQLGAWIGFALKGYLKYLDNILPQKLIDEEMLVSQAEAYMFVHKPQSFAQTVAGRKRLAYDELACYDYGMRKALRSTGDKGRAFKIVKNEKTQKSVKDIIEGLPFELTSDQKRAIGDIFIDIAKDKPMNRLIQGDVGSGKTAVAAIAMAAVALSGRQACLLAPTGVLASQHYETLSKFYEGAPITIEFLYGGMKASEKKKAIENISSGRAGVIIGTHAVIQKGVTFKDLALFVTDEQQRFGVEQRNEKLALSYINSDIDSVHSLTMSATPIPRTLAMVVYGDMDISIIREKPKGRLPILTRTYPSDKLDNIFLFIKKIIDKGQQVYVVAPRIDEGDEEGDIERYESIMEICDEQIETYSVKGLQKLMAGSSILSGINIGILTGKMSEKDKNKVMEDFVKGDVQILISTTVVEVGVNNPNATAMVIMDADRFGLSTLHQLRGRVGRGSIQSYCVLASSSRSDLSIRRLETMCQTDDGFVLAEKDLELRGPGDFFGTRQHGLPSFKAVNIFEDADKSKKIREAMTELEQEDGEEKKRIYKAIERQIGLRYPDLEVFRA